MKKNFWTVLSAVLILFAAACGVSAEATTAPDLIVTDITWNGDGQVKPDTVLQFKITVKNQGNAVVTDPFTVDIGFGTTVMFQLTHTGGVGIGQSVTLISPDWKAVSGDRMVTARVNSTGTVVETEEWDNDTLQRNLRIATDRHAPTYDTVNEVVSEAGMFDLTFNEDFNTVEEFDAEGTGREGYKWYIHRHSALPNLKPEEYRTKDGILTMDCKTGYFAIGATTIDRLSGIGYTFTHGYLEFRLRMPLKTEQSDNKTAIWSFPRERYADTEKFITHVEMDWLEYYGDNYFTVTMHEQTWDTGRNDWYCNANNSFHGLGDQQWHVMGFLWEEGCMRGYLDGELFFKQTWGPDEMPIPINKVRQGEIKSEGVFAHMDTQDMMLFIFGSNKNPLELDYVRIWQYGGEAPAAPTTTTTATTKPVITTTKKTTTGKTTTTTAALTTATTTTAATKATTTTVKTTAVKTTALSTTAKPTTTTTTTVRKPVSTAATTSTYTTTYTTAASTKQPIVPIVPTTTKKATTTAAVTTTTTSPTVAVMGTVTATTTTVTEATETMAETTAATITETEPTEEITATEAVTESTATSTATETVTTTTATEENANTASPWLWLFLPFGILLCGFLWLIFRKK